MFTELPPTKQSVCVQVCLCAFGTMGQMTFFFTFVYECSISDIPRACFSFVNHLLGMGWFGLIC